jgi:hypothetical protein
MAPAGRLPETDIRIELGPMVDFVGDEVEKYLPNTHLWQPRDTELPIQVGVIQPLQVGQ